jgi:serine phosphatase RsbU (regulator of sigma subunit)
MAIAASTAVLPILEWGVGARTLARETESGDAYAVVAHAAGMLVAVVDGLGHGSEAAVASGLAVAVLERHAHEPVAALLGVCHEELRRTRGAVLSLASFHRGSDTMTWGGIGNVEGMLFRADPVARPARESLVLRGGVVGYQVPPLRVATLSVFAGDMLVFATDGIAGKFGEVSPIGREPQEIADEILRRYAKGTDDALALVALYRGGAP